MSHLLKEINAYTQEHWLKEPADIAKMQEKNVSISKEFPIYIYCSGHIENIATLVYDFYLRAKEEKGDLETFKDIAAEEADRFSEIFGVYYSMDDLSGFLKKSAAAYREAKDFAEVRELSRILQHYLVQMSFWVDTAIRWDKVSEAFTEILHQNK
ncbi:hypothetical protein [Anaerotignum sp.]|nr:hypothetical protein [Anaerotignum sp.]MBQ7758886.1 hypothetical protein [Anaerotignum sp.]